MADTSGVQTNDSRRRSFVRLAAIRALRMIDIVGI
jgi:hypothetical protein